MTKGRSKSSKRLSSKTTLLIVGEGPDDQAFVRHMNQVFKDESSGIRANIHKESGGSPGNIISNTVRKYKNSDFDQRYIVMDSDIEIETASRKKAERHGYTIILWAPHCLEGALLDVLGEAVGRHESSRDLKQRLQPRLSGDHTKAQSYSALFPKPILENTTNSSVVAVKQALIGIGTLRT